MPKTFQKKEIKHSEDSWFHELKPVEFSSFIKHNVHLPRTHKRTVDGKVVNTKPRFANDLTDLNLGQYSTGDGKGVQTALLYHMFLTNPDFLVEYQQDKEITILQGMIAITKKSLTKNINLLIMPVTTDVDYEEEKDSHGETVGLITTDRSCPLKGYYIDSANTIVVNVDKFAHSKEIVKTLSHELHHAIAAQFPEVKEAMYGDGDEEFWVHLADAIAPKLVALRERFQVTANDDSNINSAKMYDKLGGDLPLLVTGRIADISWDGESLVALQVDTEVEAPVGTNPTAGSDVVVAGNDHKGKEGMKKFVLDRFKNAEQDKNSSNALVNRLTSLCLRQGISPNELMSSVDSLKLKCCLSKDKDNNGLNKETTRRIPYATSKRRNS